MICLPKLTRSIRINFNWFNNQIIYWPGFNSAKYFGQENLPSSHHLTWITGCRFRTKFMTMSGFDKFWKKKYKRMTKNIFIQYMNEIYTRYKLKTSV